MVFQCGGSNNPPLAFVSIYFSGVVSPLDLDKKIGQPTARTLVELALLPLECLHTNFLVHILMKKLLTGLAIVCFAAAACAGEYDDLRAEMTAARESLVTFVVNKEKRGTDQQKIVKETADKESARLAKMKAPAGKEAQFKELVDTWAAFKKTRETELVPAVLAGKDDDAKKLANGIQKERYTKCQQLLGELGG